MDGHVVEGADSPWKCIYEELIRAAEVSAAARKNVPLQLLLLLGRINAPMSVANPPKWLQLLLRKISIWLQNASPTEVIMFAQELRHYELLNTENAPLLHNLLSMEYEVPLIQGLPPHRAMLQNNTNEPFPSFISFANSRLWHQQQRFYETKSVKAWTNNHVPWQISTNGFVGAQYSEKIIRAIEQMPSPISKLIIIEVGAGHGQLSYLLADTLSSCLVMPKNASKIH